MSNTIDCAMMSHHACTEPESPPDRTFAEGPVTAARGAPGAKQDALVASYECVNDCSSSLGVVALVNGAVAGLGCFALPPACPAFLLAAPLTILQACESACRELESK
jgi:hypothetical protein